MQTQTNIEKIVMRRVHTIRVLRPLISTGALSALVFMLALWGIGREVWVARVLENTPRSGGTLSIGQFYLNAFSHTRILVQALTVITLASVVYSARELARAISGVLTLRQA